MFIELVDALRCVRPHEPTWLVVSIERAEERHIMRGVLGCPICRAEYPIVGGVADFRGGGGGSEAGNDSRPLPAATRTPLEAAAMLDLADPGGFVVLAGWWASVARPLTSLVEGVHILVVNPVFALVGGVGVSVIVTDGELPLRGGVTRGVALDEVHGSTAFIASAAAALRAGGRLVAPAGVEVPDGLTELARDEAHWVGVARGAHSGVVQLARGRAPRG